MFSSNQTSKQSESSSPVVAANTTPSTSSIITSLKRKREEENEDQKTWTENPSTSWRYINLTLYPSKFHALTGLSFQRFAALYHKVVATEAWELRQHLIKDLDTPQDKILAACLLLKKQSRQEVREKLQCSEGTIYFITQHLCPLVKKQLDDLKVKKTHIPLFSRKFFLDTETGEYYTPLAAEETSKYRIRLPEYLLRAMPTELLSEVSFRTNKNRTRVYITSLNSKATLEDKQAAYEKVHEVLEKKFLSTKAGTSLFSSLQPQPKPSNSNQKGDTNAYVLKG